MWDEIKCLLATTIKKLLISDAYKFVSLYPKMDIKILVLEITN